MRKLIGLLAALLALLLAAPALAQSGRLYYVDEGRRLDRAEVEDAARSLVDRGAKVAIYAVESGEGDEFLRRLERDGLRRGSELDADTIAIFVSFGDRYSEIRYGDRWNAALRTNNNAGAIQDGELNSRLAAGEFTEAFVSTLLAIDRAIANPPRPGGGTEVNVDLTPIAVGGAGIAALALGGPLAYRSYRRRRQAAEALAKARGDAEAARKRAGAAIADMGQALREARAKAEYDAVSYPQAEVEQLAAAQSAAEAQFVAAQGRFDTQSEALAGATGITTEAYTASAAEYGAIEQMVAEARGKLEQVEARRAELDRLNQAAPGEVDKAKKALADAAGRLGVLGDDAQAALIMRPLEALVTRAESLLGERRAADAIQAAGAASAAIEELAATLARFADIREGISAGRRAAERAAVHGYRIEAGLTAFNTAEGVLAQAARALAEGGPQAASSLLDQAEAARAEGVSHSGGLPALREENERRIAALKEAGEQLAAYIEEGRRIFDQVDEFAESTWSDIQGNGSEAEAAADEAQDRWEQAVERNTMERQEFHAAAEDLTAAEERIAFARSLIDTIAQRLRDLLAARDAARAEVAAASEDIAKGWEFVRANDPDVGKDAEQALGEAAALLAQAQEELARERPNWLLLVRQAQEANRLADSALDRARSEVETIAKLREQVARAQQVATGEVQRVAQFAGLHGKDLTPEHLGRVEELQGDVQQAYAALQRVEQTEDASRVAALREALERYTALNEKAEVVYSDIHAAFQRIEDMRRRVEREADQAQRAIDRAARTMREGASIISPRSEGSLLLDEARRSLRAIGEIHNEADMKRGLSQAAAARNAAERAESLFRQQIEVYRRQMSRERAEDLLTGMVIGALTSGDSGRRSGGGGRSSGGGGRSWGSGGSSGGRSWGGGGSSGSRSWGGGGSSGGKKW